VNLLPKDERFFELFSQHSDLICQASSLLLEGLKGGYEGIARVSPEIKAIEKRGDEVVHDIFRRLESTFLTPIDPEDIQALATALDDVLDFIEDATFRIVAYRLDPVPDPAVRLAEFVKSSCNSVAHALESLKEKRSIVEHTIEVNRLENEADALERTLVAELFSNGIDPITLIKHKEVYEILEQVTDRCEDVADVLHGVAVKNG
jgi:predicted phosphate transport protein (TIGR00153 family)